MGWDLRSALRARRGLLDDGKGGVSRANVDDEFAVRGGPGAPIESGERRGEGGEIGAVAERRRFAGFAVRIQRTYRVSMYFP